jgi:predicted DNA-binding protein (MmcQ/YjbR family)
MPGRSDAEESDAAQLLADLRAFALSLPETLETDSFGHPNFRAGRTFAAFEIVKGRPSVAVKLGRTDGLALLGDPRFFPTPYGARHGWVSLWVDEPVTPAFLRDLVLRAYRGVANRRMLAALERAGSGAGPTRRKAARPPARRRSRPA